jgi:hypothetical protein
MEKIIKLFDLITTKYPVTLTLEQVRAMRTTPAWDHTVQMLTAYGRMEYLEGTVRVHPYNAATPAPALQFQFISERDPVWCRQVIDQLQRISPEAITKQITPTIVKLFENDLEMLYELLHDYALVVNAVKAAGSSSDTFKVMVYYRDEEVLATDPIGVDDIASTLDSTLGKWAMNECAGQVAWGNLRFTIIQTKESCSSEQKPQPGETADASKPGGFLHRPTVDVLVKHQLLNRADLAILGLTGRLGKQDGAGFWLFPKSEGDEPPRLVGEIHCGCDRAAKLMGLHDVSDLFTLCPTEYGLEVSIGEQGLRAISTMSDEHVVEFLSKIADQVQTIAGIPPEKIPVYEVSYDTGDRLFVWEGPVMDTLINRMLHEVWQTQGRLWINKARLKVSYKDTEPAPVS